jgi:hypothetical protein
LAINLDYTHPPSLGKAGVNECYRLFSIVTSVLPVTQEAILASPGAFGLALLTVIAAAPRWNNSWRTSRRGAPSWDLRQRMSP